VEGQPATARAINVIGLRRAGMNPRTGAAFRIRFRILYRSGWRVLKNAYQILAPDSVMVMWRFLVQYNMLKE